MRFLFVLDPLKKLDLKWDTSLTILRELNGRGHKTFAADWRDFWVEGKNVFVRAGELHPKTTPGNPESEKIHYRYIISPARRYEVNQFDLIFLRKNPPFYPSYLHLTYVLELASKQIPVINHPRGIRETNEKFSILEFPRWIPETLVSSNPAQIILFQKEIKDALVIKPLDKKGGEGVFLLHKNEPANWLKLQKAMQKGKKFLIAQRFLPNTGSPGEKRILILDGKFAGAYEKRSAPGDFRANLALPGSTFHPASLTKREKKLTSEVGAFLLKRGLYFAGLDVLNEKLIEINVTSPAGICEVMSLRPKARLVQKVADFLESRAAQG